MKNTNILRIALIVAGILVIPLVLTLTGSGVDGDGFHWTFFDFVFIGTLLFSTGFTYDFVARKMDSGIYRAAVGLAVFPALFLVWINAAVGIIGDGDLDSPNGIYLAVLIIGFICACVAHFRAREMSRILFGIAFAIALIPVVALVVGTSDFAPGVFEVFALNGIFVVLFAASGILFRKVCTIK